MRRRRTRDQGLTPCDAGSAEDQPPGPSYKKPGQKRSDLASGGAAFGIRTRDLRITRPRAFVSRGVSSYCPVTFFLIRARVPGQPVPPRNAPSEGVCPPPVHRRGLAGPAGETGARLATTRSTGPQDERRSLWDLHKPSTVGSSTGVPRDEPHAEMRQETRPPSPPPGQAVRRSTGYTITGQLQHSRTGPRRGAASRSTQPSA